MPDTLWGWPQGFTEQDRTGKLWRDPGAMYILLFFLKQATQAHFLALEIWEIILGESAAYIVFPPQRCNSKPFVFLALRMIKHYMAMQRIRTFSITPPQPN